MSYQSIFTDLSLPNDQKAYLDVQATEFNVEHVLNAGSYRLLENDIFLYQNFLALSGEAGFCDLAYSVFSTVSSYSADWFNCYDAVADGVWLSGKINDSGRDYYYLPNWTYNCLRAVSRGYLLSANSLHPDSAFNALSAVPTSYVASQLLSDSMNPENIWQRTYTNGVHRDLINTLFPNPIAVWHQDKILKDCYVYEHEIISGCHTLVDAEFLPTYAIVVDGYGAVSRDYTEMYPAEIPDAFGMMHRDVYDTQHPPSYPQQLIDPDRLNRFWMRRLRLDPTIADGTFALWDNATNVFLGIDTDKLFQVQTGALEVVLAKLLKPQYEGKYGIFSLTTSTSDPDRAIVIKENVRVEADYHWQFGNKWKVEEGAIEVYGVGHKTPVDDYFDAPGYESDIRKMRLELNPPDNTTVGPYVRVTANKVPRIVEVQSQAYSEAKYTLQCYNPTTVAPTIRGILNTTEIVTKDTKVDTDGWTVTYGNYNLSNFPALYYNTISFNDRDFLPTYAKFTLANTTPGLILNSYHLYGKNIPDATWNPIYTGSVVNPEMTMNLDWDYDQFRNVLHFITIKAYVFYSVQVENWSFIPAYDINASRPTIRCTRDNEWTDVLIPIVNSNNNEEIVASVVDFTYPVRLNQDLYEPGKSVLTLIPEAVVVEWKLFGSNDPGMGGAIEIAYAWSGVNIQQTVDFRNVSTYYSYYKIYCKIKTITYDVTMSLSPSGKGSTSPSVGSVTTIIKNGTLSISAAPIACWVFVRWESSTPSIVIDNPNTSSTFVTVNANGTVTAIVEATTYTVTTNHTGNGSTSPNGSNVVNCGENFAISATPESPCWQFVNWTTSPPGAISVTDPNSSNTSAAAYGNGTLTANFTLISMVVTFQAGDYCDHVDPVGAQWRSCGDAILCTAYGQAHTIFDHWQTPGGTILPFYTSSINVPVLEYNGYTFVAMFRLETRTVTFVPGACGHLNGATPQVVVYGTDTSSVEFVVDDGCYVFNGWTGDYIGSTNPLIITNVTSDMTITATCTYKTSVVHVYNDGHGTTSADVSGPATSCRSISATPADCYDFDYWETNNVYTTICGFDEHSASTSIGVGFGVGCGDGWVRAHFRLRTYTVDFNYDGCGSLIGNTHQTDIPCGGSCTSVEAVPCECYLREDGAYVNGYDFSNWTSGGWSGVVNPVTIIDVRSNATVTAHFVREKKKIAFSCIKGEDMTPGGGQIIQTSGTSMEPNGLEWRAPEEGDESDVTLHAIADENHYFNNEWSFAEVNEPIMIDENGFAQCRVSCSTAQVVTATFRTIPDPPVPTGGPYLFGGAHYSTYVPVRALDLSVNVVFTQVTGYNASNNYARAACKPNVCNFDNALDGSIRRYWVNCGLGFSDSGDSEYCGMLSNSTVYSVSGPTTHTWSFAATSHDFGAEEAGYAAYSTLSFGGTEYPTVAGGSKESGIVSQIKYLSSNEVVTAFADQINHKNILDFATCNCMSGFNGSQMFIIGGSKLVTNMSWLDGDGSKKVQQIDVASGPIYTVSTKAAMLTYEVAGGAACYAQDGGGNGKIYFFDYKEGDSYNINGGKYDISGDSFAGITLAHPTVNIDANHGRNKKTACLVGSDIIIVGCQFDGGGNNTYLNNKVGHKTVITKFNPISEATSTVSISQNLLRDEIRTYSEAASWFGPTIAP